MYFHLAHAGSRVIKKIQNLKQWKKLKQQLNKIIDVCRKEVEGLRNWGDDDDMFVRGAIVLVPDEDEEGKEGKA